MTEKTFPDRLIAALTASGWTEVGGRAGSYTRLRFPGEQELLVPLDPATGDFEDLMGAVIAELEHARTLGDAADNALTLALCSCGGRRWVEDENWQPEYWAMAVKPRREPGEGLIPCGGCNFGGWNVDPVDVPELSDPSGRM